MELYLTSVLVNENTIVVWRNSPVLVRVVLVGVVLLVVGKEIIELDALSEVLVCFHASDVLEHVEVSVHVDASSNQSMPVHALQLNVRVILLEFEMHSFSEVYVRSLNRVHVFTCHLELSEVEILGEYLHIYLIIINTMPSYFT